MVQEKTKNLHYHSLKNNLAIIAKFLLSLETIKPPAMQVDIISLQFKYYYPIGKRKASNSILKMVLEPILNIESRGNPIG